MRLYKNCALYGESASDILVSNGRIEAIGELAELRVPGLEIEDLEGRTVLPALFDQHVHVTGGGGEGGLATRCPELRVKDVIKAGVGGLVGLLGTDGVSRRVEDVVAKTKALREYGFHAYCLTGSYQVPSPTLTDSVMRDIVFIDEIIGVKVALNDHRGSHPSYEELVRLAADARMAGLIGNKAGVVHIHMGAGKHGLGLVFDILEHEDIPATVFRPTHMGRHMEDCERFTALGGYVDFTAKENASESARMMDEALRLLPKHLVTLSSDSNGSMPRWNEKREMIGIGIGKISSLFDTVRAMVLELGYSWREALAPCTENVARALRLPKGTAAVIPGGPADFLVLDHDAGISDFVLGGERILRNKVVEREVHFED